MKHLHLSLFPINLLTSLHVLPHFPASSRMVLFHVCFSLPLLLAPCGFQSNACFSMNSPPFLRVCLIHHHYLIIIFDTIGFSPVASHRVVLLIILGHLMPIILHQHWLTNICNLFVIWLVTFNISHPKSSTALTLLSNIQMLGFIIIFLFLHNGYNYTKSHLPYWYILEFYSVYHYITQICKLFDSFNNYIIYIYICSNLWFYP